MGGKRFAAMAAGLMLAATPLAAQLPETSLSYDPQRTAIVITDPQNDFLHESGAAWGAVGESVVANNTRENLERLMRAGKENNVPLFVSPHYYYPTDSGWRFEGALEKLMHNIDMFARKGPLTVQGFEVAVVSDATAAAQFPGLDGYQAAMTNFRFIANDVLTTDRAVALVSGR
jgi:nicotinamidase-related amidase